MTLPYKLKESQSLIESFRWLAPKFKTVSPTNNTIKIKGVALRGDAVSRNKRHYVSEELKKAARSWIGKPLTINHDPRRIAGHIEWMEYEDDLLEYLATVNKQPYVDLLRNKSADMRGVSVEANYLRNECPRCGKHFYTEEEFHQHMHEVEFIKTDPNKEPHGIIGTALSLVLAPEEPGVPGTTVELMETVGDETRLLETIIKERETMDYKIKEGKKEEPTKPEVKETEVKIVGATEKVASSSPAKPTPLPSPIKEATLAEPCSAELKACVDALIADGKPEDSAWAICKSKLGETIKLTELKGRTFDDWRKEGHAEEVCALLVKESRIAGENNKAIEKALNDTTDMFKTVWKNEGKLKETIEERDKALINKISTDANILKSWTEEQFKTSNSKVDEVLKTLSSNFETKLTENIQTLTKAYEEKLQAQETKFSKSLEDQKQTYETKFKEYESIKAAVEKADKTVTETAQQNIDFLKENEKLQKEIAETKKQLKEIMEENQKIRTLAENTADKMKGTHKGTQKSVVNKESEVKETLPYQT